MTRIAANWIAVGRHRLGAAEVWLITPAMAIDTTQRMNVFVAGVQKGGTSALHAYLARHPDLCAAPRKELHVFDDETRDWRWPCGAALDRIAPPDGRMRMEATPITLFWPGALERLARYNPWARLILIFRDPVARAWSHWCMEYARGAEDLTFDRAIRDGRQRMAGLPRDAGCRRVFSYIERGRYGAQLAHALTLFPRRQLLLLRSQDLADDPGTTLGQVSDFLGIAPFDAIAPVRLNERADRAWPSIPTQADRALIMEELGDDLAHFARLSGLDVGHWGLSVPA